jgi:hypothetical protein
LDLRFYRFFFLSVALLVFVNAISDLVTNLASSSALVISLAQSIVSGLSFLLTFVLVTRHYVSTAPHGFWLKFILLALVSFLFYALLTLMFGEPLLRAMGFEVTPVPQGSPLSPSEYARLSFFTYGISSITNGLISVAVAYILQKYMVWGVFYAFKRLTKYRNFFEADSKEGKLPIYVMVLWLLLLPFPIQNVLTPTPAGVSVLGTGLYLLSTLALFLMWGLGLAALVGITKNKIFRLHSAVRETLFWFLAIQWLSVLVYSSLAPPFLLSSVEKLGLLIVRTVFAFTSPALITAYLYKRVLEKRAETRIVDYLKQKEGMETARIDVRAEQ